MQLYAFLSVVFISPTTVVFKSLGVTIDTFCAGGPAGGGGEYTGGRTAGGDSVGYGQQSNKYTT